MRNILEDIEQARLDHEAMLSDPDPVIRAQKQMLTPKLRRQRVMSLSILPPAMPIGHQRQTLASLSVPPSEPVQAIRSMWY